MVNLNFLIQQHVYYLILIINMIRILNIVLSSTNYFQYFYHSIPKYLIHNNHHYETFNIYLQLFKYLLLLKKPIL